MNPRRHIGWVLAVSFALVIQFSCAGGEETSPDPGLPSPGVARGGFIVRVITVVSDLDEVFVGAVRECSLPVWNELKEAGVVSTVSVFELSEMETTYTTSPAWHYLVVVELGPSSTAEELLAAEENLFCPTGSDVFPYSVLREEHMVCTPNSCFGMPEPTYPDARAGIDYLIEFIAVENTTASLSKYHDLMSSYFGPANGVLVERGILHCLVALEVTEADFEDHEVLSWNQVHVSDHWDEGGDLDWDTVYEHLFREEFSRELDDVWSELPPINDSSTEYRARLVPDLCVR
jgi:hypothetical protein